MFVNVTARVSLENNNRIPPLELLFIGLVNNPIDSNLANFSICLDKIVRYKFPFFNCIALVGIIIKLNRQANDNIININNAINIYPVHVRNNHQITNNYLI
jgi:hypothetical protein